MNFNYFAEVILPLSLPLEYTYGIPQEYEKECIIGKRVVVQFGKKKLYSALIKKIHQERPKLFEIKEILAVLDENPILSAQQFKLWEWLTGYYMCTWGEVLKAALPAGFKLESESNLNYNPDFDKNIELTEKENKLIRFIEKKTTITIDDAAEVVEQKSAHKIIQSLIQKQAILIDEQIVKKYKPKLKSYIKLSDCYETEIQVKELFDKLEKAPKQLELLMQYFYLSKFKFSDSYQKLFNEISKTELLEKTGIGPAILDSMIKKNIFMVYEKTEERISGFNQETSQKHQLNEAQQSALEKIRTGFEHNDIVLLHGITSSGKTEVYIHLIEEYLNQGKQILYLLPEIALTAQIINRLQKNFGNKVGIYHSKFNDSERIEIWNKIHLFKKNPQEGYQIILGVRSAIFLPFSNLGLIIVDEEHENTFKQFDPAPRYNARDAALVLGKIYQAKILLGTATPSMESYYNSMQGKYVLVELLQRHLNLQLPEIIISDTKEARKKKQMKSLFAPAMLSAINQSINNKEQVILFQNKRGFSPYVECKTCGWIPKCEHCDVSLTYHKHINHLVCHYCGFSYACPTECLACGDVAIETRGFGTEKIEDEISLFFPTAKVERMDLDTTRNKNAYEKIISRFENRQIDILVGTQMISKGLDFDNVSLVGIMNADNMLNYPDFRAFERSYQLMAQVSGRAGRKNKRGKVIIQTSNPQHEIIKNVVENDYIGMYKSQLKEREYFHYPPFFRLIEFTIKHKDKAILDFASDILAEQLKTVFKNRVLGPEYPIVNRIQNWYLKTILLKIEKSISLTKAKEIIWKGINYTKATTNSYSLIIQIDVDPM